MSKEDEWVEKSLDRVLETHTSIPEDVQVQIKDHLKDQLSEKQLSAGKISKIAKKLINDMTVLNSNDTDNENED